MMNSRCRCRIHHVYDEFYKIITLMIYLFFVQSTKHRMQIMQELWEFDLTTNSVKFMQQFATNDIAVVRR